MTELLPVPAYRKRFGAVLKVIAPMGGMALIAYNLIVDPLGRHAGDAAPAIALTTLPTVAICWYYRWLDGWQREPIRHKLNAFLWGASVAVVGAGVIGVLADGLPDWAKGDLVGPVAEELAKGMFVCLILGRTIRRRFDNTIGALVLAGLSGAGLAFSETSLDLARALHDGGAAVADVGLWRLLLAPFGHSLLTSLFGLGLARAWDSDRRFHWQFPLLGLLGAAGLHGLWNLSIDVGHTEHLAVYVLVVLPTSAVVARYSWAYRRRTAAVFTQTLPDLVDDELIRPQDAGHLASVPGRRAWLKRTRPPVSRSGQAKVQALAAAAAVEVIERTSIELALARRRGDTTSATELADTARTWQVKLETAERYHRSLARSTGTVTL